jgi:hypothetical protein
MTNSLLNFESDDRGHLFAFYQAQARKRLELLQARSSPGVPEQPPPMELRCLNEGDAWRRMISRLPFAWFSSISSDVKIADSGGK